MPYLNIKVSAEESKELSQGIVSILMENTTNILGKKEEVTSINIEYMTNKSWFVGGRSMKEQSLCTFYLDVKITEGTNSKLEKAAYIKKTYADLNLILGKITPASYIVIDDVRGDSWGFDGKTQEYRFIHSLSL